MSVTLLWWALAALTVAGAVAVIATREMMRMLLGLGAFLLGLAGFYAWYGFELLAVAELFVYVGGVLVLFLFAITSMGRDREGRSMERRLDLGALGISAGMGLVLLVALQSTLPAAPTAVGASVEDTAAALLGPLLPYFELAGVVLLVALVAALAIIGREDAR
ncbi:MAG TPA: NADH-quinone oxidoreductase subunit J [Coriobacteriia bacterium]